MLDDGGHFLCFFLFAIIVKYLVTTHLGGDIFFLAVNNFLQLFYLLVFF